MLMCFVVVVVLLFFQTYGLSNRLEVSVQDTHFTLQKQHQLFSVPK